MPRPEMPTLEQVGVLVLARTVDGGSNMLGTFTSETRPTDKQVEAMIELAYGDILRDVGHDIPEIIHPACIPVIALKTAMYVELSKVPEQVRADRTAVEYWERMYNAAIPKLEEAAREAAVGGDPGDVDDIFLPAGSFPSDGRYRAPGSEPHGYYHPVYQAFRFEDPVIDD